MASKNALEAQGAFRDLLFRACVARFGPPVPSISLPAVGLAWPPGGQPRVAQLDKPPREVVVRPGGYCLAPPVASPGVAERQP
eukprot:1274213-Lingulodinium_polyedra.AAC.1